MGVSMTCNHDRNSTHGFSDIQKISSGYFLKVSKYMAKNPSFHKGTVMHIKAILTHYRSPISKVS